MADSSAHVSGCSGLRRLLALSRREVLRVGGLCGLGLSLPTLLAQQARGGSSYTLMQQASWDALEKEDPAKP